MNNKGVILIIVLWIISFLSISMYTLLIQARNDYSISSSYMEEEKLKHLAFSAVDLALDKILREKEEEFLQVHKKDINNTHKLVFKISDESGKLNMNKRLSLLLMKQLISMEDYACINDFIDDNEETRQLGAESDFYSLLENPYLAKNKPFDTLEELLYVKEMDYFRLYGKDKNQNGKIDKNENKDGIYEPDKDHGLYELLTAWSYDVNEMRDGTPRLNINKASSSDLTANLGDHLNFQDTNRILAIRNRKLLRGRQLTLRDVFNTVPSKFIKIVDRITTVDDKRLVGLINLNTAPIKALKMLPISEKAVAKIVAYREKAKAELQDLSSLEWVFNAIGIEALNIIDIITTRSSVFSIDIIATPNDSPIIKRYKVIIEIDRKNSNGKILYTRDLSSVGLF